MSCIPYCSQYPLQWKKVGCIADLITARSSSWIGILQDSQRRWFDLVNSACRSGESLRKSQCKPWLFCMMDHFTHTACHLRVHWQVYMVTMTSCHNRWENSICGIFTCSWFTIKSQDMSLCFTVLNCNPSPCWVRDYPSRGIELDAFSCAYTQMQSVLVTSINRNWRFQRLNCTECNVYKGDAMI